MKKSLLAIAVAAVVGLTATAASATPFIINNGADAAIGANGSTKTSTINTLGYTATLGTSFYYGNPAVAGTAVMETNIASVMTANGFTTGAKNSIAGSPIANLFRFPGFSGDLNIDALNDSTGSPDLNGFTGPSSGYGFGGQWGLTYSYQLHGVTTGTDIKFTSGYFDVFYQTSPTGAGAKQVLRLVLDGSQTQPANLKFLGHASFDFDGNGTDDSDAFVQSFWNDAQPGGQSFYNTWLTNKNGLQFAIDSNVNPPLPLPTQLWNSGTFDAKGNPILIRQSELSGTVTFKIPEPGSVALLGLGLAGLGLTQRRRNNKAAK